MEGKPNLFIVGAPKCATTSLATWLGLHPEIHMSPVKEPHFLNTDQSYHEIKSTRVYEKLFVTSNINAKVFGEASVYYAYSSAALNRIASEFDDAKVIFCIRNPLDMIKSLFLQQRFANYEDLVDINEMWRMHDERIRRGLLPRECPDPIHIDYKTTCNLGDALERILGALPREKVKVVNVDNLKCNPKKEYQEICDFLGVYENYFPEFKSHNEKKSKKYPRIYDALRLLNRFKKKIGLHRGFGVLTFLNGYLVEKASEVEVDDEIYAEMKKYFSPQIDKLEDLLGIELSQWK